MSIQEPTAAKINPNTKPPLYDPMVDHYLGYLITLKYL